MNKEEIIIDSVDVAECERHCMDNHNIPNRCYSDITEGYRDCKPKEYQCFFYVESIEKQLQRLKQENEKLKKELKQLKDDIATGTICIQCETAFEKCKIYADIEGLRIDAARAKMEAKNYRKALEEVKVVARQRFESNLNEEANCYNTDMERIENIINEVLK